MTVVRRSIGNIYSQFSRCIWIMERIAKQPYYKYLLSPIQCYFCKENRSWTAKSDPKFSRRGGLVILIPVRKGSGMPFRFASF
jgi:hypothetical protein